MVEVVEERKESPDMETHYKSVYELLAVYLLNKQIKIHSSELDNFMGKPYRINMIVEGNPEDYTVTLFLEFPEEENAENQSVEKTPEEESSEEAD